MNKNALTLRIQKQSAEITIVIIHIWSVLGQVLRCFLKTAKMNNN